MSFHIFKEENIAPTTRTINIRNIIDSTGPHKVTFGVRTVFAAAGSATYSMQFSYENDNGVMQTLSNPSIDLSETDPGLGGVWYKEEVMTSDRRHPLGDGLLADPYGAFTLNFILLNGPTSALISYDAIFTTLDGSSSVVYHP